jgi:hypothetical protein
MRIVPAFFVLFICSAGVNAASIKIEFSGTFGTFCYSSCQEAGLDSLVGESFSASFIIPDQSSTPTTVIEQSIGLMPRKVLLSSPRRKVHIT